MTFCCKFTDAEIETVLRAYAAGADRFELCARYGISVRTLFRWQAKAGRNRPALRRLVDSLAEENARLRNLLEAERG